MDDDRSKVRRADSVRNRAAILAASRARIAEAGPDVSMADIAQNAGVAVGTLYRHFPTKTDLVAAVLAEYVDDVADRAQDMRKGVDDGRIDPGTAVSDFLRHVIDASAMHYAVKTLSGTTTSAVNGEGEQRAAEHLDALLEAAQRAGAVREGVTVDDVYLLVETAPFEAPQASRDRWLDLVLHGIRTRA